MPSKGKKRQLHAVRNHQDNPNAVKNRQDNLNAVKNRQDNPNAVRKQLISLLWYYHQNCLICHLAKLLHLNQRPHYHFAKLPHLNRGPTLNHYNLAKLPHLNRDHISVITTSPSSRISIGGHISATTTSPSTRNITFVTRDDRNSPVKTAKPTIGSS